MSRDRASHPVDQREHEGWKGKGISCLVFLDEGTGMSLTRLASAGPVPATAKSTPISSPFSLFMFSASAAAAKLAYPGVTTMPEFQYQDMLPIGADDTPYRLLTRDHVSTFEAAGKTFLK